MRTATALTVGARDGECDRTYKAAPPETLALTAAAAIQTVQAEVALAATAAFTAPANGKPAANDARSRSSR
ncbi:MAG TPA: hypothetical protein VH208_13390 [Myxococcaceae bacterium]|nr:hypothetical protein [Myxococcaceae bacterium]